MSFEVQTPYTPEFFLKKIHHFWGKIYLKKIPAEVTPHLGSICALAALGSQVPGPCGVGNRDVDIYTLEYSASLDLFITTHSNRHYKNHHQCCMKNEFFIIYFFWNLESNKKACSRSFAHCSSGKPAWHWGFSTSFIICFFWFICIYFWIRSTVLFNS